MATSNRRSGGSTSATKPTKTRAGRVQLLAERAVLLPLGASLIARDDVVSTVRGLTGRYRTRAGVKRELGRYERRGASARNRFERQVRRTRTQFERELRQRRTRVEKLVSGAQERIGNVY